MLINSTLPRESEREGTNERTSENLCRGKNRCSFIENKRCWRAAVLRLEYSDISPGDIDEPIGKLPIQRASPAVQLCLRGEKIFFFFFFPLNFANDKSPTFAYGGKKRKKHSINNFNINICHMCRNITTI